MLLIMSHNQRSAIRQMTWSVVIFASAVCLPACQTTAVASPQETVEVIITGSDIETEENTLTRQLRDQLEAELTGQTDIGLALADRGTLELYIPELVEIDRSTVPPTMSYVAEISRKGSAESRRVTGSCATTQLTTCSRMIVGQLRTFLGRPQ